MSNNFFRPRSKLQPKTLLRYGIQMGSIVLALLVCYICAGKIEGKLYPAVKYEGTDPTIAARVSVMGKWYEQKPEIETTLVIGVDKFGDLEDSGSYNNDGQSDFLMLLTENKSTGERSAIHINRDTMTSIPILAVNGRKAGTFTGQLALAFNYGSGREDSCKNVCEAVSNLLYGLKINHYIAFTMEAVPILNDMVGGVPVKIEDNFSGVEDSFVMGETVLLKGEKALTFIRSRSSMVNDKTNLNRMERQRAYVTAWAKQAAITFDGEKDISSSIGKLVSHIVSDYTVNDLEAISKQADEFITEEIYSPEGEAVLGDSFMEFYVNEASLREYVLNMFYSEAQG